MRCSHRRCSAPTTPVPDRSGRRSPQAAAAYGGPGCAARVAQAFGEHPETAVTRMRWARTMVARAARSGQYTVPCYSLAA